MKTGHVASFALFAGMLLLPFSLCHAEPKSRGSLVEGRRLFLASCQACHGPRGHGDGPIAEALPVHPRDLTDHAKMASKSDEELFKAISGGGEAVHASRYMPFWKMNYNEEQIWDLVSYVRFLHEPRPPGNPAAGEVLFLKYCTQCHGVGGRGDGPISQAVGRLGPVPLDFTNKHLMETRSDQDLYFAISAGAVGLDKSGYMPSWAGALSDQEMWNLVAYLRTIGSE